MLNKFLISYLNVLIMLISIIIKKHVTMLLYYIIHNVNKLNISMILGHEASILSPKLTVHW